MLQVYLGDPDHERAGAFLAEMLPKLDAWHGYLYRERNRNGDGLIEIWHPWESGMDNSPLWDPVLSRIELADGRPEYERIDRTLVNPDERPTDWEYDRYAYLVELYRDLHYDGAAIRESCPFVVHDVLFNSLLYGVGEDAAIVVNGIASRLGASTNAGSGT